MPRDCRTTRPNQSLTNFATSAVKGLWGIRNHAIVDESPTPDATVIANPVATLDNRGSVESHTRRAIR